MISRFSNIDPRKERIKIPMKDINGKDIYEGSIITEGKIGEQIWDKELNFVVVSRPVGIVYTKYNPNVNKKFTPDEDKFFSVYEIKPGLAKKMDDSDNADYMLNDEVVFHLSLEDDLYFGWDDCEVLGDVRDFV